MSYNVVFENTIKAGGYAGVRTWRPYHDEEEFTRTWQPDNNHRVLAKGVSQEEAINLCLLTPEICYLTVAVEEMCAGKDSHINVITGTYEFSNNLYAIECNRLLRNQKHLLPDSSPFPFVEIGEEDTEKNRLFRFIKKIFTNPDGTIGNLGTASKLINTELYDIGMFQLLNMMDHN